MGFVFGIGDPEPGGTCFQDMTIDGAIVDEVVDDGRDVAFTFFFSDAFVEETGEVGFDFRKETCGEAPEVHGDDGVFVDEAR